MCCHTKVRSLFWQQAWCERRMWTDSWGQSQSNGFLWTKSGVALLFLTFTPIVLKQ